MKPPIDVVWRGSGAAYPSLGGYLSRMAAALPAVKRGRHNTEPQLSNPRIEGEPVPVARAPARCSPDGSQPVFDPAGRQTNRLALMSIDAPGARRPVDPRTRGGTGVNGGPAPFASCGGAGDDERQRRFVPTTLAAGLAALVLFLAPASGQEPPAVAIEETGTPLWYYLQDRNFAVRLAVWDPNNHKWVQGRIAWNTNESLIFYTFSRHNPEALVKILDGRGYNGHWWGDFAALSDLRLFVTIYSMSTHEYWNIQSGRAHDMGAERSDKRRMVCASPHYRSSKIDGFQCVWGTGLSSREAYGRDGRIPDYFWTAKDVRYLE